MSHSTSYAMISYWMAWLKVHYPVQFMAATLSTEYRGNGKDRDQKIIDTVQECKRMGIKLQKPDINLSGRGFSMFDEKTILYGLSAVKNVGPKAVDAILKNQPYKSLSDFVERVEKRKCNKRVIISLILAGAFDFENTDRLQLIKDFYSIRGEEPDEILCKNKDDIIFLPESYTVKNKLDWERILLGAYISAHPLDELELPSWRNSNINSRISVAGISHTVTKTKVRRGASKGRDMGFVTMETPEGDIKVVLFPDVWDEFSNKISRGKIVRVYGKLEEGNQIIANKITNPRISALNEQIGSL